jgi:hypothetical protein
MAKKIRIGALGGLCLFWAATAHAESTLKDELRVFAGSVAAQCRYVTGQDELAAAGNNPLIAYTLKDAVQSLCVCIPGRHEVLMKSLPAAELARPISEPELMNLLKTRIFDFCAARQFRNMYGQQCTERFKAPGLDVRKYCSCMSYTVSTYPDTVAAEIAFAAEQYIPLAAAAEKEGAPVPERPPVLEQYYLTDKACKGKPGNAQ